MGSCSDSSRSRTTYRAAAEAMDVGPELLHGQSVVGPLGEGALGPIFAGLLKRDGHNLSPVAVSRCPLAVEGVQGFVRTFEIVPKIRLTRVRPTVLLTSGEVVLVAQRVTDGPAEARHPGRGRMFLSLVVTILRIGQAGEAHLRRRVVW